MQDCSSTHGGWTSQSCTSSKRQTRRTPPVATSASDPCQERGGNTPSGPTLRRAHQRQHDEPKVYTTHTSSLDLYVFFLAHALPRSLSPTCPFTTAHPADCSERQRWSCRVPGGTQRRDVTSLATATRRADSRSALYLYHYSSFCAYTVWHRSRRQRRRRRQQLSLGEQTRRTRPRVAWMSNCSPR